MTTRIAVLLPAYNEAVTIRKCLTEIHDSLPCAELIVIDNASTDSTAEEANRFFQETRARGRVLSEQSPGKARAVRRGLLEVDADVYVLVDADATYPVKPMREMIDMIVEGKADLVVGDRHSGGAYSEINRRPAHEWGNRLVAGLVNQLFGASLTDILSGLRVFGKRFAHHYPVLVDGFQLEVEMTLYALDHRFRIVEVPIGYQPRPAGSFSKLDTVADGQRILVTMLHILRYYRPLQFFGGVALLISSLGFLAGLPVLMEFIETAYIRRVPLAILAAALEVMALITGLVGLILDSIVHHHRLQAERDLVRGPR